jgi:hypothetical protein
MRRARNSQRRRAEALSSIAHRDQQYYSKGLGSLGLVQTGIMRSWTNAAGFTIVSASDTAQQHFLSHPLSFRIGMSVSDIHLPFLTIWKTSQSATNSNFAPAHHIIL